jgi:putative transposase
MRASRTVQLLSYELRLPDTMQAAALRLLDASREVINATVAALWERLDDFGMRETKYAYKQVTALIDSNRRWLNSKQGGTSLR